MSEKRAPDHDTAAARDADADLTALALRLYTEGVAPEGLDPVIATLAALAAHDVPPVDMARSGLEAVCGRAGADALLADADLAAGARRLVRVKQRLAILRAEATSTAPSKVP